MPKVQIAVNDGNLAYKLYILVKCIYLSFLFYIDIMTAGILKTVQNSAIVPSWSQISRSSSSMFSREPFLYKNEIRWMIALHCLQTSRGNLQNMFSGNRCYKIWLLCICGRNHPKIYLQ